MGISRRGFMNLTGVGLTCLGLSDLGFDLRPAAAYATTLRIEGCKEYQSTCPFCSCGCSILMFVRDGQFISSEGDPDYPISAGGLCEGAAVEFETIPSMLRCETCGDLFKRKPFDFTCPCGGQGRPTDIGREFYVKAIEVENEPD